MVGEFGGTHLDDLIEFLELHVGDAAGLCKHAAKFNVERRHNTQKRLTAYKAAQKSEQQ